MGMSCASSLTKKGSGYLIGTIIILGGLVGASVIEKLVDLLAEGNATREETDAIFSELERRMAATGRRKKQKQQRKKSSTPLLLK
jgi:hypothetical protein